MVNHAHQIVLLERLHDIAVNAGTPQIFKLIRYYATRNCNDPGLPDGPGHLQMPRDTETIDVRHAHIQKDQVIASGFDLGTRLLAAICDTHAVAFALQHDARELAAEWIVIRHEDMN